MHSWVQWSDLHHRYQTSEDAPNTNTNANADASDASGAASAWADTNATDWTANPPPARGRELRRRLGSVQRLQ